MALALNHSAATGTAKVVLLGIASHEGELGAFPAVERLARYANVAPDNARKAIRKLEELGELETIRNGGLQLGKPEHTRTNMYRVTITCPEWCDRSSQHRDTRQAKSGPSGSSAPRNRRTDASDAPGPSESSGEPQDNQLPNYDLPETPAVDASAREVSGSEDAAQTEMQRLAVLGAQLEADRRAAAERKAAAERRNSTFRAPEPTAPRYYPPLAAQPNPPQRPRARTEAEADVARRAAQLPCQAGTRVHPTHWLPGVQVECCNPGCGMTIAQLAEAVRDVA